ncbi:MAG: SpoIIE family protein phosphatase [Burkholderiales bacterium]|nr:SpoIIE family protein phosphatase [Burkholderiales bacterium]
MEGSQPVDAALTDTRTVIITTARPAAAATRVERVHYLVVTAGAEPGRRVRLGPRPLRLGRRAPCELVLADPEVSALHCEVGADADADAAWVDDRGSTNGSYVDGVRVEGRAALPNGALLQLGQQVLKHEYRPWREAERSDELDRDLQQAGRYIRSLLPPPNPQGPVRTDWVFEPSAQLGGDAFGYFAIDEHRFAGYLIDVSGHGIGAAVHTVSVLNVMRQRALGGVDFGDPAQVLARLNEMFPMEEHGGLFFTFWYGVYDLAARRLRYASAGHHPAYLVDPGRSALQPLRTRNPMIGALPPRAFAAAEVEVAPGSTLYVFSDGVFEIDTVQGRCWGLGDFTPLLLEPPEAGLSEPLRLQRRVRAAALPGPLADDFSILAVTFPT